MNPEDRVFDRNGEARDILAELRTANIARNKLWDSEGQLVKGIGLLFFAVELGGEAGEALNKVKKLIREEMGMKGSRATIAEAVEELADVIIVCDLIANLLNADLRKAIIDKHNKSSDKIGLPRFMESW